MLQKMAYDQMDWFVRPEIQEILTDADLINGTVTAEKAKDFFMPLTEYAKGNAEPSLKNAVPHEINWLQSSVNGEVYGISNAPRCPLSGGWVVDPQVLNEYGLTEQDFQKDYWEMDELLEKIENKSGTRQLMYFSQNLKTVLVVPTLRVNIRYPGVAAEMLKAYFGEIGSVFAVDDVLGVPTVINMLDTETSRKIQDAIIRYKAAYAVKDTDASKVYFNGTMVGHKPYTVMNNTSGTSKRYLPIGDSTYYNSESMTFTRCSGVAVDTKYKNEAISLLSLIAEDEEFRMQLMFGKEGRDYTIDAKGNYCVTKQEDGSDYNMSFLSPWSYFSGLKSGDYQYPGTEGYIPQYEGMTALESYLEMWENVGEP